MQAKSRPTLFIILTAVSFFLLCTAVSPQSLSAAPLSDAPSLSDHQTQITAESSLPTASNPYQTGTDDGSGTEEGGGDGETGGGISEDVNRLFTGLGVFAAMMAVMAVGTEVVVDMFRVLIGMKRKVTALEAFTKLEKQLPGQLAELGVSTEEIEDFKAFVAATRSSLIKPVTTADAIRNGRLGEIARCAVLDALKNMAVDMVNTEISDPDARQFIREKISAIIDELKNDPALNIQTRLKGLQNELLAEADKEGIAGLKTAIKNFVDVKLLDAVKKTAVQLCQEAGQSITEIAGRLSLPESIKNPFMAAFTQFITGFQTEIEALDFDKVYEAIEKAFNKDSEKILIGWLESQTANLARGPETIKAVFDGTVKGFLLNDLQLKPDLVGDLEVKLNEKLANLGIIIEAKTGQHVEGAKELLNAVEYRRQKMGSPLRKALRAIRETSFPVLILALGIGIPIYLTQIIANLSLAVALFIGLLAAALLGAYIMRQAEITSMTLLQGKVIPGINETTARRLLKYYKDQDWLIIILGAVTCCAVYYTAAQVNINQKWAWLPAGLTAAALIIYYALYKEKAAISNHDREQLNKVYTTLKAYKNNEHPDTVAQEANITKGTLFKWAYLFGRRSLGDGLVRFLLFSIGDFFFQLETLFNYITLRDNSRGQIPAAIQTKITSLKSSNLAAILQERDDQHRDEEASRLRWLRIISAAIGIILAVYLHVDAALLLDKAIPDISGQINLGFIDISQWTWNPTTWLNWQKYEGLPEVKFFITPGILLTGLAASAGSAFWHDVLDRLQASKKSAEAAAKLYEKVQQGTAE